jgi:hypothetical protein
MKSRLLPLALGAALVFTPVAAPAFAQDKQATQTKRPGNPDVVVDDKTDQTIKASLRWLASKQLPSGAFTNGGHQAAFTSYVLMAFLSAGEVPNEGEHGKTVQKAVDFLLTCVRPDGYIAAPTGEHNMYGHGISAIALGEVYGMTRDPAIRPKLERAIKLIVDTHISVTVLQVVALRVAKNSGIEVPQDTIDRAVQYVKSCNHAQTGGFTYQSRGGSPGFARTAAAIYSLQVCGLYDDPMVAKGSQFLLDKLKGDREWFTYGAFYAAPAQYMIGGDTWAKWYQSMSDTLLPQVKKQGDLAFWAPLDGGKGQNEVYATAVYTMILAMPYQYVPLYQR